MKTLVTGANGHIGSHIVKFLLEEEGREVRGLVRKTSDLRGLEGLDLELAYGDILDPDSLKEAVKGCDVIYHTAAVYSVWKRKAEEILRPSIEGSKNLFRAIQDRSVDKVVYTSSIAAVGLGSSADLLMTAADWNEHPSNPYIQAKTEAERWVQGWASVHKVPVVFVLPSIVLGPGDYKPTPSNKVVLQYLNGMPGLLIDGGINIADVRDVARGHILAEKNGAIGARYILGGENVTFRDFYNRLAEITHRRVRPWLWVPTALKKVVLAWAFVQERALQAVKLPPLVGAREMEDFFGGYAFYDIGPTVRALGYSCRTTEEVLKDTVQWLKEIGMVHRWTSVLSKRGD